MAICRDLGLLSPSRNVRVGSKGDLWRPHQDGLLLRGKQTKSVGKRTCPLMVGYGGRARAGPERWASRNIPNPSHDHTRRQPSRHLRPSACTTSVARCARTPTNRASASSAHKKIPKRSEMERSTRPPFPARRCSMGAHISSTRAMGPSLFRVRCDLRAGNRCVRLSIATSLDGPSSA